MTSRENLLLNKYFKLLWQKFVDSTMLFERKKRKRRRRQRFWWCNFCRVLKTQKTYEFAPACCDYSPIACVTEAWNRENTHTNHVPLTEKKVKFAKLRARGIILWNFFDTTIEFLSPKQTPVFTFFYTYMLLKLKIYQIADDRMIKWTESVWTIISLKMSGFFTQTKMEQKI